MKKIIGFLVVFMFLSVGQAKAEDGYTNTILLLKNLESAASGFAHELKRLCSRDNNPFYHMAMSENLAKRWPGSSYSCSNLSGVVVNGNLKTLFQEENAITTEEDLGGGVKIITSWLLKTSKITDGINYITFRYDYSNPHASKFIDVNVPTMVQIARTMLDKDKALNVSYKGMIDILNTVYGDVTWRRGVNMYDFAIDIIQSPESQEFVIQLYHAFKGGKK
ncbi:MAG: hypothetical protein M1610_00965 [Nitrospirae bacterium]|nr:hypothetical protein [Nitrospirota bacterium]MDA8338364.1 hypothetical protein [Nitrospiraceae bacterium]